MNDFDFILDDCLTQISSGASSLDECLARHPNHAARLEPLLRSAARVVLVREVKTSPAFKALTRAQLYAHMDAHPHRRAWMFSPVWRMVVSLAVLVMVFLATGTALAQSALPGQTLYAWKLSSEQMWRTVSPDPVGVDLALADRRADEIIEVSADPARESQALNGYLEVLARLKSEEDAGNKEMISLALKSHQEKLSTAGISIPQLNHVVPPAGSNPIITPKATPIVPVLPPLPKVVPTFLPKIIPSHVPPIIPTLPVLIP